MVAKEGTFTFTGTISSPGRAAPPGRLHPDSQELPLVNVSHIYNIFKDSVTMDNKEVLPMSKQQAQGREPGIPKLYGGKSMMKFPACMEADP